LTVWRATGDHPCAVTPETFLTRWELEASPDEVSALISDTASLSDWWPAAFLTTRVLDSGHASGVGRVVDVLATGFLPFALRFRIRTTLLEPGARIGVEATGDIEGMGLWALEPFGRRLVVRFRFVGGVSGGLGRSFPRLARPLFRRSYAWAMERGFTSLLLAVWRGRTNDEAARAWLPRAPRPAFPNGIRRWLLARRTRSSAPPLSTQAPPTA
jgi:hypothetical protein